MQMQSKSSRIRRRQLDEMESDFDALLITVLKQCAEGQWGLFGQNDGLYGSKYLHWAEAEALKNRATQIRILREEFGEPNPLVERFLHYCSLRGANVSGEPKLAKAFLEEIEAGGLKRCRETFAGGEV